MAYRINSGLIVYTAEIDGKSATDTIIFVTDPSRFVPTLISLEPVNVVSFTSAPTLSLGADPGTFTNILSSVTPSALSSDYITIQYSPNSGVLSVAGNSNVYVNVSVAAVATTYTLRVSLIGFYY